MFCLFLCFLHQLQCLSESHARVYPEKCCRGKTSHNAAVPVTHTVTPVVFMMAKPTEFG